MRYLEVHTKLGGDIARSWLTQTYHSDVPWQHVVWCSAITAEVKKEKGRLLEWWHFSFQETVMHDDTCFPSWRWLSMGNTCLSMENSEWIPWFAVLVCIQLLLCLLNCLYFSPWILTFTFWILSPNHLGRVSKHLCGTGPSCLLGLNHNCGSCLPVANSVSTVILEIKRDSKGEFFKRPIQIKPLTFKTKEYSVHQLVQIKSFWMWSSINNILSFTSKESLVVLFFEV